MISVFVISLARTPERRASICGQLDALRVPFTVIEAVDGHQLSEQQARTLAPRYQRLSLRWPLSKGEIACAVSHRLAIERILSCGEEFGCVIEDDGKPEETFPEFLDADWLIKLPRFDILKLAGDWASRRELFAVPIASHAGRRVCVPLHPSYSTRCYIVSRPGAARVLRRLRVLDDSADVIMFRRPMTTMRFLDIRPNPVGLTDAESTLQADRWFNAPVPWWRPILSWAPRRLAVIGPRLRRYAAFIHALGPSGFRRLEIISLDVECAAAAGGEELDSASAA